MNRPDPSRVAVVIPAAGTGTRLGGTRKQFRTLGGKPLLVQTVLCFQRHPAVDRIVVVAPAEAVTSVQDMCREYDLSKVREIVRGGDTRQDSVRAGVSALDSFGGIVMTHDGVRPFVAGRDVDRLIEALQTYEAAALAIPVSDTMCRSEGDVVTERVNRDGVFRLLTPQAFRSEVLGMAYEKATADGNSFTDEVTMVTSAGSTVKLVTCTSPNIKITTPLDWEQALWIWPKWEESLQT